MLTGDVLTEREIDEFERFLVEGQDWVVQRVIDYATELGYSKYASPLREAWCVAINGLAESLVAAVRASGGDLEIPAEEPVREDPALEFGIREAGLHRSRGVDFGMFLGLMKYNEQAFVDLVKETQQDHELRKKFQRVVRRFFDRVEIGFCTEWSGLTTEEAVAELQARNVSMTGEKDTYLRLFEAVNAPVIILDPAGLVVNINERAAREFGVEGVEGSAYYSRKGVGIPFAPIAEEVRAFSAGEREDILFERKLETVQGTRDFAIRLQRLLDVAGACTHMIVVMSDVTTLRHMQVQLTQTVDERTEALRLANEDLVRANRVKDEFLASMSHEFRTPLNSIIGFSSLLAAGLAGAVNEEQSRQLGMIASAGEHLLRLVNDLLDLSRIEAGRLEIIESEFELTGLCKSIMEMMAPIARAKRLELECVGDCDEVIVRTDRDKVTQIMLNLISNAVKFTDEGTVSMTCLPGTDAVRVSVRDTGRGLHPSEFDDIFDEFRRSSSSLSPSEGSGLGLAISRKLARLLGGDIEVESVLGVGSAFTLVLPLATRKGATAVDA